MRRVSASQQEPAILLSRREQSGHPGCCPFGAAKEIPKLLDCPFQRNGQGGCPRDLSRFQRERAGQGGSIGGKERTKTNIDSMVGYPSCPPPLAVPPLGGTARGRRQKNASAEAQHFPLENHVLPTRDGKARDKFLLRRIVERARDKFLLRRIARPLRNQLAAPKGQSGGKTQEKSGRKGCCPVAAHCRFKETAMGRVGRFKETDIRFLLRRKSSKTKASEANQSNYLINK